MIKEEVLNIIQERASERIIELLDALDIDYSENNNYIHMQCPIHGGDNPRGAWFSFDTNSWKCMTQSCELLEITGPSSSIFGLIRGILSTKFNKSVHFLETVKFVCKTLNINLNDINNYEYQDKDIQQIVKKYKMKTKREYENYTYPLLSDVKPKLISDDIYYPARGISPQIIDKYHISFCKTKGKPFYNRAFFPILDESGKFVVGFSARTIYEKCNKCKLYHHPKSSCPAKQYQSLYAKWKHSKGFKAEHYLYNYWFAKRYIHQNKTAIVCEGPGDVWQLEEAGIHNGVAIMGLNISKTQRQLLQKAEALTLVLILDNDKSGIKAVEKLKKSLQYFFRLFIITPENMNDIGEMFPEEIVNKIGQVINNIVRRYHIVGGD